MTNLYADSATFHQKEIVLVHGAWQAAYAWSKVQAILTNQGFNVTAVQLPGHGSDETPHDALHLDSYIDYVKEEIEKSSKPVILVGHSMAGMIISGVSELIPEMVEKLVYLAAYLPQNGQSAYNISLTDKQSLLGKSLQVSEDQVDFNIIRTDIAEIFCQDATHEVKQLILDNYRPEPGSPFGDTVTLTSGNFGKVDKYYIETLLDNGIGNHLQKEMIAATKIKGSYSLNSGHSPALTLPKEVSDILKEIALI